MGKKSKNSKTSRPKVSEHEKIQKPKTKMNKKQMKKLKLNSVKFGERSIQDPASITAPVLRNGLNRKEKPSKNFPKEKSAQKSKLKVKQKRSAASLKKTVTPEEREVKGFGCASSESEAEPIEATWDISDGGSDGKDSGVPWGDGSVTDQSDDIDKGGNSLSSDLEQSESDIDEELDEKELNQLLLNEEKNIGTSSSSSESDSSELDDIHEQSAVTKTNGFKTDTKNSTSMPLSTKKTKAVKSKLPLDQAKGQTTKIVSEEDVLAEVERRAVDLASRSLYLTPLPVDCSHDQLKQLSPLVTACRLSFNPTTKQCRKFAFIEFADVKSATTVRKSIMGRLFAGRPINVQPVRPQFQRPFPTPDDETPSTNRGFDRLQLFVTSLNPSVSKQELTRLVPKACEIDYPRHANNYPLGYAIVKFVNEAVALEAFNTLHRRVVQGQPLFVNFVTTDPKHTEKKRKKTEAKKMEFMQSDTSQATEPNGSLGNSVVHFASRPGGRTKVVIQEIVDNEEQMADNDCVTGTNDGDSDSDSDTFIRPVKSAPPPPNKPPSTILSQLVKSRRDALKKDADESETDEDNEAEEEEEEEEDSDAEVGDEDDDDDNDKDVSSNEGTEESEEDSNDVTADALNTTGGLFDCPASPKDGEAVSSGENSSDEEVDRALAACIRDRRKSLKALKGTGSSKRAYRSVGRMDGGNQRSMLIHQKRHAKPFVLPVPTKRRKT